jgi:hypothetical protein
MKSENKRWIFVVVSAVLALCLNTFSSEAKAQTSVNVRKGQLEHATWYKSNTQLQIVDDGPIVHDYRTAPKNDPGFQIPIGPTGNGGGQIPEGGIPLGGDGPRQARMEQSSLPRSGFGPSNIPSRGMGPMNALPGTKMGGLGGNGASGAGNHATTGVSARPILHPGINSATASPAAYNGSYSGAPAANYGGGGGGSSSSDVRGKLLGHH